MLFRSLGDLDVAAPGQRFDFHEQSGHAVAHLFVVEDAAVAWRCGNGRMDLADQLPFGRLRALSLSKRLVRFIQAHDGEKRIVRQLADRQHIFQGSPNFPASHRSRARA